MTGNGLLQLTFYFAALTALAVPLGRYMAARLRRARALSRSACSGRSSALLYRLAGVRPGDEMSWQRYAVAVLLFNVAGHPGRLRAPAPPGLAAAERRRLAPP